MSLCARVCRGAPVENPAEMPARKGVSVSSSWKSDGGTTVPPIFRGLPEILERVGVVNEEPTDALESNLEVLLGLS